MSHRSFGDGMVKLCWLFRVESSLRLYGLVGMCLVHILLRYEAAGVEYYKIVDIMVRDPP
jgi:hypothetical protein